MWSVHLMLAWLLVVHLVGGLGAAHARHWLRKEPAVTDLTGSITRAAYSSLYDGCQKGGCACGIPAEMLKDLKGQAIPYVALNIQEKCERGETNVADNSPSVCGVSAFFGNLMKNYAVDSKTGKTAYALVADACTDNTFWCRNDVYHLSFSQSSLHDLCGNDTECLDARRIEWKFINAAPAELALPESPMFAWLCQARIPWYNPLLIYNTHRGISSVSVEGIVVKQDMDRAQRFLIPAQTMVSSRGLPRKRSLSVEVFDSRGESYGTYGVPVDPGYIASACTGATWAAKVDTGMGSDEKDKQLERSQVIGHQRQEVAAWATTRVGEDLDADVTWRTENEQVKMHNDSPDLGEIDDLDIVLENASTGLEHSVILPADPITPETRMPGAKTCLPPSQHMSGTNAASLAALDAELPYAVDRGSADVDQVESALTSVPPGPTSNKSRLSAAAEASSKINKEGCGASESMDDRQVLGVKDMEVSTCTVGPTPGQDASQDLHEESPSCQLASAEEGGCGQTLLGSGNQVSEKQKVEDIPERLRRPGHTLHTRSVAHTDVAPACRPMWGQCGGKSYNGVKCCEESGACKFVSQWYSQCQPMQS